MFQRSINLRKAILGCTASALVLAIATPALAQDTTPSDNQPKPKVAPDQIAGPVGPAQERTGTAQGGEIVVTGLRASIQASLDRKKRSDIVSEVVTAQDIGKFPDKNVADSLGRLTGVNVVTGTASAGGFGENQQVSIRGTDPSLNLTLLDGHGIATGDWFVLDQTGGGRSFDFSVLPSEIVGRLEVYKSSEADIPEGGVGGTINVINRLPFDLPAGSFTVTAQGNYNDLRKKWAPQISGLFSWKNPSGTFGVLATGFYQERYFRRDGQEILGYTSYDNFNGTGQTVSAPNLIGSAYFRQDRVRKGGTVALQFRPSPKFELDVNGLYSRMDANNINTNSMAWISNVIGSNSTPGTAGYALLSDTITNGVLTAASWANMTAGNATTPPAPVFGRIQDDIFRQAYSSTWDINADATWHISDRAKFDGQVGYTKGKGATSDTYAWETYWATGVNYQFQGRGAVVAYPGLPADFTSPTYLDNFYSWSWGGHIISPDKEFYAKGDLDYEFGNSFLKDIKIGARYTDHQRDLDYIAYAWAGNPAFSGTQIVNLATVFDGDTTPSGFGNGLTGVEPYSLADQQKVLQELSTNGGRRFDFYPQGSFSVKEKTEAGYAMARFDDDSHWRGNLGVRAIRTVQDTLQYSSNDLGTQRVPSIFCPPHTDPVTNVTTNYCTTERVNRSYWDILPSANITYAAQPDLLFRAGVARVMTRPSYSQLAGAFTLNATIPVGTAGGNPFLKPFRAWDFNAAAEWYYGKQALLSVNLFYLKIGSYITTSQFKEMLPNPQTKVIEEYTISGPVNGVGGSNKGIEINWQQPIWGGFGVIANYTYTDAKKADGSPLEGNSKHNANLIGYFENKLISARLAYNYRSKFLAGFDRGGPIYQDNYGTLDGSLVVNLNKHFALTADAQNLFDRKLYYFIKTGPSNAVAPLRQYHNGRTFWVGGKVTF